MSEKAPPIPRRPTPSSSASPPSQVRHAQYTPPPVTYASRSQHAHATSGPNGDSLSNRPGSFQRSRHVSTPPTTEATISEKSLNYPPPPIAPPMPPRPSANTRTYTSPKPVRPVITMTPTSDTTSIPVVSVPHRPSSTSTSSTSTDSGSRGKNGGSGGDSNSSFFHPPTSTLKTNSQRVSSTTRGSRQHPHPYPSYGLSQDQRRDSSQFTVTQTDQTLEGLANRWNAYQAVMKKYYQDAPFYGRWTISKAMLFLSAVLLLLYSCAVLVITVGYVTERIELAPIAMEFHFNLIAISMAAALLGIVSAIVGLVGTLREDRRWLSWYAFMLWPTFALYIAVGYIAFRRSKAHLRAHLQNEWTYSYTRQQRLLVQRQLKCCGYQNPFVSGAYDLRCFPLTNLPGCLHKYNQYEERLLTTFWTTSFSIAPVQLFVMLVALLCSNHVDGMLRSGRPELKSFKETKEE